MFKPVFNKNTFNEQEERDKKRQVEQIIRKRTSYRSNHRNEEN